MEDCILVADPDPAAVGIVLRAAHRLHLRVVTAENGIEAIERFRSEIPRIVILDHLLPVLNGPRVADRLRETLCGPVTPVLLTGCMAADERRQLRDRHSLSDVLDKPFDADAVLAAIAPFLATGDEPAGPPAAEPDGETFSVAHDPLARVLVDLAAAERTGVLTWRLDGLVRSIYLRQGRIVGGASNGRRDRWPAWLARDPRLGPGLRARLGALAVPGPGVEGWGPYLEQQAGFPTTAFHASRERWLLNLSLEMVRAESGFGCFAAGVEAPDPFTSLDAGAVAMVGLRGCSGESVAAVLPPPFVLLGRPQTEAGRDISQLCSLEHQLVSLADGRHSLGDLLALGRLIQRDFRPLLHGMLALRLVEGATADEGGAPLEVRRAPDPSGAAGTPSRGDLAETHLAGVLARLSAAGQTGIVQASRGEQQVIVHVQDGRVVFARSSRPDLRLGNVLLRSGKISPEDHQRALLIQGTERAKRLGAILLDIGALSLKELHEGLCCQVREILEDACLWADGRYAFIAGDLPTADMVSLDVSTPNLLLGCLRLIELDDSRAHQLPAGSDHLRLAWEDGRLSQLLRLTPAESEVLRLAAEGRDFAEILAAAGGGEVEAAQAVFALLGVGCLERSSDPGGPTSEVGSASAMADAAEPGGEVIELLALRREVERLRQRLIEAERENCRLRDALVTGGTIHVG